MKVNNDVTFFIEHYHANTSLPPTSFIITGSSGTAPESLKAPETSSHFARATKAVGQKRIHPSKVKVRYFYVDKKSYAYPFIKQGGIIYRTALGCVCLPRTNSSVYNGTEQQQLTAAEEKCMLKDLDTCYSSDSAQPVVWAQFK